MIISVTPNPSWWFVAYYTKEVNSSLVTLIERFMGQIWGPSGADRTHVGPMLAPWILLSGLPAIETNLVLTAFVK